jgi:ribonuclease Z
MRREYFLTIQLLPDSAQAVIEVAQLLLEVLEVGHEDFLKLGTLAHQRLQNRAGLLGGLGEVKPRLVVAYHTIRQPELDLMMIEEVRKVYDGPLVIADDLMAWTITKDSIVQREVVSAERVQAPPTTKGYAEAKRSGQASYSKYIDDGKWKGYTPPLPEK